MKKQDDNRKQTESKAANEKKVDPKGYPLYPASEDMYHNSRKEKNIDPEDISGNKKSNLKERSGKRNEKDFKDDVSGGDLDVPGSELDDNQEMIGSEDEENNYYSIGGDDHEDLDEDKGD